LSLFQLSSGQRGLPYSRLYGYWPYLDETGHCFPYLILCIWPITINTYQFAASSLTIDNIHHNGCAGETPLSDKASMIVQVLEDGTLIVAESLVAFVTVRKTFKFRGQQGARGPRFSRLLLRDGTILFLVLAILAGIDMLLVLITFFGPSTEFVQNLCLVQNLLVALRVVLVCRFMLNLRAICYDDSSNAGSGTINHGRLASKMIGTLGSSLRSPVSQEFNLDEEYEREIIVSDDPFVLGMMMDDEVDSTSTMVSEKGEFERWTGPGVTALPSQYWTESLERNGNI